MTQEHVISRRNAILAAGTLAAGAWTAPGSASALVAVVIITGIDGGGAVKTDTGDAQFSIFATQITTDDVDTEPFVIGQVHWTATDADGATLSLESTSVDAYGWIDGVEGGRWLRGQVSVNGQGEHPFLLRAVDAGPPGSGADTIELAMGSAIEGEPASDVAYHAEGILTAGDLQVLEFAPETTD